MSKPALALALAALLAAPALAPAADKDEKPSGPKTAAPSKLAFIDITPISKEAEVALQTTIGCLFFQFGAQGTISDQQNFKVGKSAF